MNEKMEVCVEVEAAKALVRWKALFGDEVAAGARRLAVESGERGAVTLAHYRRAAQIAVHSLSAALLQGVSSGDAQEAA